jgi:hypothetical protein
LERRAAEHTRNRPTGRNLGLERYGVQIVWVGMSKMRWSHLTSLIQGLLNLYGFPSAVLVHCGGNDIGHTEPPCDLLTYQIKVTFVSLFIEILPDCPIIWSSILPRIKWRLSKNTAKMEKTRKRINRHFRSYFLNKNCYVLKYPDFDDKLPALFDPDGTYLSFIGNDMFINAIQGALETFFKYPYIHVYPYN